MKYLTKEQVEKIAMEQLKYKWQHLYTFGYPKKPFPTNYENDLSNVKVGIYEGFFLKDDLGNMSTEREIVNSLLERAMLALDDYLNAGCKEERQKASEKAKLVYKEYYGIEYINRNER